MDKHNLNKMNESEVEMNILQLLQLIHCSYFPPCRIQQAKQVAFCISKIPQNHPAYGHIMSSELEYWAMLTVFVHLPSLHGPN